MLTLPTVSRPHQTASLELGTHSQPSAKAARLVGARFLSFALTALALTSPGFAQSRYKMQDQGLSVGGSIEPTWRPNGQNDGFIRVHTRSDQQDVIILAKTNPYGELQWARQYGTPGHNVVANQVRPTSDGGYIVAGTSTQNGASSQLLLIKTTGTGALSWAYTYPGSPVSPTCVREIGGQSNCSASAFDGFVVVGVASGTTQGILLRVQKNGTLLRAATYSDPVTSDVGFTDVRTVTLPPLNDGEGFLIAGWVGPAGARRSLLLRTNNLGSIDASFVNSYRAQSFSHDSTAVELIANGSYAFSSQASGGVCLGIVHQTTGSILTGRLLSNNFPTYPSIRQNFQNDLFMATERGFLRTTDIGTPSTYGNGPAYTSPINFPYSVVPAYDGGIATYGGFFGEELIKSDLAGNACGQVANPAPTPQFISKATLLIDNVALPRLRNNATIMTSNPTMMTSFSPCYVRGCAVPPWGMVTWLPFDEITGTVAHNLSGPSGVYSTPQVLHPSHVDNYVHLGGSQWVSMPDYLQKTFDRPFSVDCWVRRVNTSGVATIAEYRDAGFQNGWSLQFRNGALELEITVLSVTTTLPCNITVPAGVWSHVVVTVSRGVTGGIKFYVDNASSSATMLDTTSIYNPGGSIFSIGRRSNASSYFTGDIDEFEIFNRALAPDEVRPLFLAGTSGKCKESCAIGGPGNIERFFASFMTTGYIRNRSATDQFYDVWFQGLPVGALSGCVATGPTEFTPAVITNVHVPAFSTIGVNTQITVPPALFRGQRAGYAMFAKNTVTGRICSCAKRFYRSCNFVLGFGGAQYSASLGGSTTIPRIQVTNSAATTETINYQIVALDADHNIVPRSISLDGLPPGTAITGSLTLAPNQSGWINAFTVGFVEARFEESFELAIQSDIDGDLVPDSVATAGLVNSVLTEEGAMIPFGTGCGGLAISNDVAPYIGGSFGIFLNARPALPALLLLGASNTQWGGIPLPFDLGLIGAPGCSLLVSTDIQLLTVTDPNGAAALRLALPTSRRFIGGTLYFQWVVVDPTANLAGLLTSRGLAATVGG